MGITDAEARRRVMAGMPEVARYLVEGRIDEYFNKVESEVKAQIREQFRDADRRVERIEGITFWKWLTSRRARKELSWYGKNHDGLYPGVTHDDCILIESF